MTELGFIETGCRCGVRFLLTAIGAGFVSLIAAMHNGFVSQNVFVGATDFLMGT